MSFPLCHDDDTQCEHCHVERFLALPEEQQAAEPDRPELSGPLPCHCGWLHEMYSDCPPAPVTCTDCGYTHMGVGHWKTNRYGMPVPTGIAKQEMKENGSYDQWLHWHRLAMADAKRKANRGDETLAIG
jgi:hypothetical protein